MIATAAPKSKDELEKIRGMRKDVASGKLGDEIIGVLQKVKVDNKIAKRQPTADINFVPSLVEMLKLLLKIVSQQHDVVPRLIASDIDLHRLGAFQDKNNPVLEGWRNEVFGKKALKLRNGQLSIHYNPKNKHIEFLEQ